MSNIFLWFPILSPSLSSISLKIRLMDYLIIFHCDESLWRIFSLSSRCLVRASHDQRFRTIIRIAKSGKKVKSSLRAFLRCRTRTGHVSRVLALKGYAISPDWDCQFPYQTSWTPAIKLFGNKTWISKFGLARDSRGRKRERERKRKSSWNCLIGIYRW